jgi:hypothetical protein
LEALSILQYIAMYRIVSQHTSICRTNWNRTVNIRRKAAKRTLPFELTEEELELVSLPPPDEEIPARKKPRLQEPLPVTTDEATRETASPAVSEGISPLTADGANANKDSVTDTQPNDGATLAIGNWTLEEDTKLTRAVANTSKKMSGKKYKTNWPAVAVLVPGRTKRQCYYRWHDTLDRSIDRASGCAGKWNAFEDSKLKYAVQTHGGKDWGAIAALVPGRSRTQCCMRWHHVLDPSIDRASGHKGKWTAVEDSKLKDAVQTHGEKNWGTIAGMVLGRTHKQCWSRWQDISEPEPNIGRANGRTGRWSEDKDSQLKHAVQTRGEKDWVAISVHVPGRSKYQCWQRWNRSLRGKGYGALKKAPSLGQNPHSP